MHVGVAHHFGWAILVSATDDHRIADRRRVELVETGLPAAPIHHRGGAHDMHDEGTPLDDDALGALVQSVRASVESHTAAALDELSDALDEPVRTLSVRGWPVDFPVDVSALRRPPFESRADSVMYCQVFADDATRRGWAVHHFDAKTVESEAGVLLGDGGALLTSQRSEIGPPWNKDHRLAFAATIVAARSAAGTL